MFLRGAAVLRGVVWFSLVTFAACLLPGRGRGDIPDAGRQFQTAVALYEHRQFDQAERALEPLLRQFPNDFQINELMGLVCAGRANASEANAYLSKAVRLKPDSVDAHMVLAANLVELHQAAQAEREFKKAVELDPGSYEANHNLGEFYIRMSRVAAALPYLSAAQRVRPSAANNGYDLALAEIKTGDFVGAKKRLEGLLAYQNSRQSAADLHALLATADERTGQYLQAAREAQLAAQMDPSEANIFAYGSELLLHHTLDLAAQVYGRGVQLYPGSARLRVGLGIALYSRGRYQDAIEAFCRAIDFNPDDPRPYNFLGKIYDISPLQASAVSERFARFAALQPRNPQALYYYAMSLWKGSRVENQNLDLGKVEKLLATAVAIEPSFAEAHLQLGVFYAQQGRRKEAIAQYRQAIHSQAGLADAHYRLAEAMARSGQRAAAQQEFETFNRLHQQDVEQKAKERSEIMQFVYTAGSPDARPQ